MNKIPAALKNIDLKAALRSRGIYLKQKQFMELKEAALPLAERLVKERASKNLMPVDKPRSSQFTNEQIQTYWEKQIHIVEVVEKRFEVKLQQFINKMVNGFLGHLESEIATTKKYQNLTKDYFSDNEDDLLAEAQLDFTPLLNDISTLAGQAAMDMTKTGQVYTSENLRKMIAENISKFTQSMLDTDRETLINIVSNGIQNGDSVAQIRGAIQADFDNITKNQAERITRTEVLRSSNQAAVDAWQQSGVVEGKQWVTAGAVDECADYEGEVEALDGNFYSDTSEFLDGDPPLHPNCRCVLIPVLLGETAYVAQSTKQLRARITELEAQFDKRTKEFRELKAARTDDAVYIKALEDHLGVGNGQE